MVPREFSFFPFYFSSGLLSHSFSVSAITWEVSSSDGVWVTFIIELVLDSVGIELWLGLELVLLIHIICYSGLSCLSLFLSSPTSQ